jgi:hypothetical protein
MRKVTKPLTWPRFQPAQGPSLSLPPPHMLGYSPPLKTPCRALMAAVRQTQWLSQHEGHGQA